MRAISRATSSHNFEPRIRDHEHCHGDEHWHIDRSMKFRGWSLRGASAFGTSPVMSPQGARNRWLRGVGIGYPTGMSTPPDDAETPHEGILHHLAELERLIERRIVQWDAEDAILVQRRLDRLAAIVRRIAAELRGH